MTVQIIEGSTDQTQPVQKPVQKQVLTPEDQARAEAYKQAYPSMMASKLAEEQKTRTIPMPMQTRSMYSPPSRTVQMQPIDVQGQPSISEMLLNVRFRPLYQGPSSFDSFENRQRALLKLPVETKPFAIIAGMLSVPEGLAYSLLNLVNVPTRNLPPAPSLAEPEYALGWGVGEIATAITVSYVGGKIIGLVAEGSQWVGSQIESKTHIVQRIKLSPVGEWYYGTKEQLPSVPKFEGSRAEEFLIEHSETYREQASKGISEGLVDVPDIGYTAPRTMSEKVLKLPELESPYQLKGLGPLEAESGALSFADVPRTTMLDPELVTPIENPITREIFTRGGLPFLSDVPKMPSTDFLPKFVSASAFLGFQAFQVTKPAVKSQPALTPLAKLSNILDQPSRTDLIVSPDVAQILKPIQTQKLKPLLETTQVLKPISMTKIVSPSPLVYRFDFPKDFSFKQDFKIPKRKKRKRGTGLYVWEFPILSPEKVLQIG